MGTTPKTITDLSVGKHTVEVSKSGYESQSWTVTVSANVTENVSGELTEKKSTATSGSINGHEWVDLGLSVKWATCNVGASKPSDYGNYYAWGETLTKSTYTSNNSKTYGKSSYNYDIGGKSSVDAARANWSGTWRLPTMAECQELVDKCTWTWTTQGGSNGCRVSGPNGNSIFLPAAGFYSENKLSDAIVGTDGDSVKLSGLYWCSEPDDFNYSNSLNFFGQASIMLSFSRYCGLSVRPVTE